MPVPKKKKSKSKVRMHRAHEALKPKSISYCSNPACGVPILPHHACQACGHYNGRLVAAIKQ